MEQIRMRLSVAAVLCVLTGVAFAESAREWVRVNGTGYFTDDPKVAVYLSLKDKAPAEFAVCEAQSGKSVLIGHPESSGKNLWGMKHELRLDFSTVATTGSYFLKAGETTSPIFRIGDNLYEGSADFLLNYMRQQRCGDNPYTGVLCHQFDGYIVDHPTSTGLKIDVRGGWHDATDYLQYTATSATGLAQLMFAWLEAPDKSVFRDEYDARGRQGGNGVPDLLDEIRYGLDWLMRMNPEPGVMFNQIADDRDHVGMRLPQNDHADYGYGPGAGRPVYFVTGEPQQAKTGKNRTTGVSSTAGKFASTFALGAEIFEKTDPALAQTLRNKAAEALRFGESKPGNTQTVCVVSPYFYEEDNFADDMEFGAAALFRMSGDAAYLVRADRWGSLEPVFPWVVKQEKSRHYQYYPFVNLGHYYLAVSADEKVAGKYREFMRRGLEELRERGQDNAFQVGVPFIWCSNNLVSAAATQAALYRKATGDREFVPMETALRDWLLGCNPWGTAMIVGWPRGGPAPKTPHSSYVSAGGNTPGGLVDGPVYRTVFTERAGKSLTTTDTLAALNNGLAVYHDDLGDYASNEPTMDGTAGLVYYFSQMEARGCR